MYTLKLRTPETTNVKSVFFPLTDLLVGSIFRYQKTWQNKESVWDPREIHPVVANSPKANLLSLIQNMEVI